MDAESRKLTYWLSTGLLILVASCGLLLSISIKHSHRQTETPEDFPEKRFKNISIGMPVEEVFHIIGYPFIYVVHSLRSGGSWDPPVNWSVPELYYHIKDAAPFLSNKYHRVTLEYSRPRREGGSFRVLQVAIQDGHVINTDDYSYWSFFD